MWVREPKNSIIINKITLINIKYEFFFLTQKNGKSQSMRKEGSERGNCLLIERRKSEGRNKKN